MKKIDVIPEIAGAARTGNPGSPPVEGKRQAPAVCHIPDIALSGLYRWVQHDGELDKVTLAAALKQVMSGSMLSGLLLRLETLRRAGYNELVDGGWLNARHPELARSNRLELVAEYLGKEIAQTVLTDNRLAVLFPPVPVDAAVTTLPLSIGSAGFDRAVYYTLKHYLPENSLSSIYGRSGSYKSFLAVSWACHIAAGVTWAGNAVAQGAVLYVVGEGGIGIPRRIRAWEMVYHRGERLNNLWLVNRPVFPVNPREVSEVVKAIRQMERTTGQKVRFIVIDTLARCFGGNDENDARDMGSFIEGCDVLRRETGATLLVVHHSGKDDSKGARGSSAFRAALDAEYNICREGSGGAIILTCTKMKDAEEPQAAAFDLQEVELFTDGDGDTVGSLVVRDVPREPLDVEPVLATVSNLTDNHVALWQCIRSRKAQGQPCNLAVVRDDMKALLGENARKSFHKWMDKLVRDGLVHTGAGGEIFMVSDE